MSFVNNFFIFSVSLFVIFLNHSQAIAYLLYHIHQPFVNNFFQVIFKSFDLAFHSTPSIIPPGLSSISYFASAVSATKIILPSQFRIVNVFLVFYLIRTIQIILTIFCFYTDNIPTYIFANINASIVIHHYPTGIKQFFYIANNIICFLYRKQLLLQILASTIQHIHLSMDEHHLLSYTLHIVLV